VLGAIPWEYDVRSLAQSLDAAPRVLLAGGYIDVGPLSDHNLDPIWDGKRVGYVVSSVDQIAPLLASLIATHVDLIKAGLDEKAEELPPYVPVITELIHQSHARGYRVAVHAFNLAAAKIALSAGADVLAHTVIDREVDGEFLNMAVARSVPSLTTIGMFRGGTRLEDDDFVLQPAEQTCGDPEVAAAWREWAAVPRHERPVWQSRLRAQEVERIELANIRRMHGAGVPIAVGSDGGNIGIQHGSGFQSELQLMAKAGLTPMEIIVAATQNGARALGRDNDIGSVQPGKVADLLLLDANPLDTVANLDRVTDVIVRGRRVSPRQPK